MSGNEYQVFSIYTKLLELIDLIANYNILHILFVLLTTLYCLVKSENQYTKLTLREPQSILEYLRHSLK